VSLFAIILLFSGLVVGAAGVGVGVGAGGGGSSGSGAGSTESSSDWNNIVNSSTSSSYRTSEYNGISISSTAFDQINLANAYSLLEQNNKNVAGDDVDVAVIDTGINLTHNEFSGNKIRSFSDGLDRDYANNDTGITDGDGHGSHVAGIIAAGKDFTQMHGVAYNARIVGYKVFDDNGSNAFSSYISDAINQSAIDGVSIINLSLGFQGAVSDVRSALIIAKNNDILTLAANGNCRGDNSVECNSVDTNQPSYPAKYAFDPDIAGYLLAIGSVDASSYLSSFSQLCGDALNYCLVAPGESINSTTHASSNSYDTYSGTSMATPMVSGVAAILRSAWPHLTAPQTAQILLQSATDLGESGVDSTYGAGLLNAEAAVNYIGQTYVPSTASISSVGYNISDSNLTTSSVFGDAFVKNIIPQINNMTFFDDFGRDYNINFSDKISIHNQNSTLSNLIFNQYQSASIPIIGSNSSFSLKFIDQKKTKDINGNIIGKNYFNINNFIYDKSATDPHELNKRNISFLYQKSFNKNTLSIASNDYLNHLNNKFTVNYNLVANELSFNNLASSGEYVGNLNQNNLALSHKLSKSFTTNLSFSQTSDNYNILNSGAVSDILQFGFDYNSEFLDLDIDYGNMSEYKDYFLGGSAIGAFSNSNNSKTNFVAIKNKKKITKDLYFISSYSQGLTNLSGNKGGIFRSYSDIKSRGFSAGIFNDNFFNGKLAINYSEPLRVYSGAVNINIPIGYNNNGNVQRLSIDDISLKPSGKEKNFEISYNLSKSDYNLNLNLLAIEEFMNIKDSKNEYLFFLKYNKFW
jgi:subtilisin family serine protease